MKLNVLPTAASPWFAEGLEFTCTQCGNCCTGGPGYVWITKEEIALLARHLELSPQETIKRYCRRIGGKYSLKERRTPEGNYDCVFLKEVPAEPVDGQPQQPRKVCSIYEARPLQCRTWPFWEGNLQTRARWNHAGRRCHGINQGRHFSQQEIESIRDAAEWPEDPPTS